MQGNEKLSQLIEVLMYNPRISIRELSARTGLSYTYVRRKINALYSKGLLSFSAMASPEMVGKDAAVVKIRGVGLDRILDYVLNCNRVLVAFKANSEEVLMVICGRCKHEIADMVELLRSRVDNISEIVMEYGVLPEKMMLPVKNNFLKCRPPVTCNRCWLGTVNSKPKLLLE